PDLPQMLVKLIAAEARDIGAIEEDRVVGPYHRAHGVVAPDRRLMQADKRSEFRLAVAQVALGREDRAPDGVGGGEAARLLGGEKLRTRAGKLVVGLAARAHQLVVDRALPRRT